MVDVYGTEPERQKAVQELTALRRELKTETAAGAKAAAKDPRFIAAKERLDKAKSAAGMRTSAEDLAALNRTATSDTATMKKDEQGRMTAAPTRAERAVTKELNQPSRQYFKQVKDALTNPEQRPTWEVRGTVLAPKQQQELIAKGFDVSGAKNEWILVDDEKSPSGQRWNRTVVGIKAPAPKEPFNPNRDNPASYGMQVFFAGKSTADEFDEFVTKNSNGRRALENATINGIRWSEIADNLPNITYQDLERLFVYYGNRVETVEELVAAYEILFGGNK